MGKSVYFDDFSNWHTYDASTGERIFAGAMILPWGKFGKAFKYVDLPTPHSLTPSGGGSVRPFALGIDDFLDDFARTHSADTWKRFDDVIDWQSQVIDKLADPSQRVLFNLDGVDVWGGVSRAASGKGGATDWELLQIYQNKNFWDTLEFWQDGLRTTNPFE
jgi:hypothetical protein